MQGGQPGVFMVLFLITALCPAWAGEDTWEKCRQVAGHAGQTYQTVQMRDMQTLDRLMGGITDQFFNLDCINRISLSGGIRFYGPGDLLGLLKQHVCGEINRVVDRIETQVREGKDVFRGMFGLEYHAGVRVHPSRQPVLAPARQLDLNGDLRLDSGGPRYRLNDTAERFHQTLKELFK